MISEVVIFLKDLLNAYLNERRRVHDSAEDQVVFIDGERMDSIAFKSGAISLLLINVEEEKTTRPPDPYRRTAPNGTHYRVQPEIRLNLYVLFVARYQNYEDALKMLSLVIKYFQGHRLLQHPVERELSEEIEPLVVELVTLPLAEQNHIWSSLRTAYQPSVLYKVRMVVFQDQDQVALPEVQEITVQTFQ
jgi:hypothetical protein